MKKQSKKAKAKEDTPKRKYTKKIEEKPARNKNTVLNKGIKGTDTEEEQTDQQVTESQTPENKADVPTQTEENKQPKEEPVINQLDENYVPHVEPQSRPPFNPETDLNQSQVQALRSRFSHLTANHFEGGTAEEVLQHLAGVTNTDINELRTVIQAWTNPPQVL